MTKHERAIEKIRAALAYVSGLKLETEAVLPGSDFYNTLGGLSYHLSNLKDHVISIEHNRDDEFNIFIRRGSWTALAKSAKFKDLAQEVQSAIKHVGARPG